MVHPLHCSLCWSYFPAYLNEFCSFHPQDPEFPTIQFKNASQPFGKYSCCQAPVFRYQPVAFEGVGGGGSAAVAPGGGCQSRDHRVKLRNDQVRVVIHPHIWIQVDASSLFRKLPYIGF